MTVSFGNFVAPKKNLHLTHLEDVLIDDGMDGVLFAIKMLKSLGTVLSGRVSWKLSLSHKWDGAPAIVFGPDPLDGRFFISTKAAFSNNPKLAKSHAEITALFDAKLASILLYAFDALQALHPTHVLQGDLLYTNPMLTRETIEGADYFTFRPNTLVYAVPVESELAQRIVRSSLGIALHTMYTGPGPFIASYSAEPLSPSVYTSLARTPQVVALDATYDDFSGNLRFSSINEWMDYLLSIDTARAAAAKLDARVFDVIQQEPMRTLLKAYINFLVRTNTSLTPQAMVGDFLLFASARGSREVAVRSSVPGRQTQSTKYLTVMDDILRNDRQLTGFFALHAAIARTKNIAIGKLAENTPVQTFVPTDAGLKRTGPEGFVARMDGRSVKLVDRLEFSRLNFNTPKNWQ